MMFTEKNTITNIPSNWKWL